MMIMMTMMKVVTVEVMMVEEIMIQDHRMPYSMMEEFDQKVHLEYQETRMEIGNLDERESISKQNVGD